MPGDPFGLSGQVIEGQFRIDHPIGEGGFSVVYKGLHLGLDEPVAIKVLKLNVFPDTATIESFSRRFRDESRIAYRLSQGNLDIVRSMTAGTTVAPMTGALLPYMVLEWLEGCSLGADLRQRRSNGQQGRTLEEVVELFEPAAAAIAYAHGQGIIHRDIKPGNLYLARTRAGTRLKVLDFGLAKVLGDAIGFAPSAQTLGTTTIVCSPSYGAPEQFDSRLGPVGGWTDVYSFGILILEALRDKRVRTGEGLAQCALQALSADFSMTCHALGIRVAPQVEVALARAVAIDPGTRQKHVGLFWEQLKVALTASGRRRSRAPDPVAAPPEMSAATVWDPRGAAQLETSAQAPAPAPPVSFHGTAMMLEAPPRPAPVSVAPQSTLPIMNPSPPLVRMPASPLASTGPTSQRPAYAPRYAAAPPAPSTAPPPRVAPPPPQLPAVKIAPSRAPLFIAIALGAIAFVAVAAFLLVRVLAHTHR